MSVLDVISISAFLLDNCISAIQLDHYFAHRTEKINSLHSAVCQTAFGIETVCYPPVYPLLGWGFKHEYHVFGLQCSSECDVQSRRKEKVGRKVGK